MSEHTHEDQDLNAVKPVSFTVPFILAAVTLFIVVMFLSLCDPKNHHKGEGHHDKQVRSVMEAALPESAETYENDGAARTLTAAGTESAAAAGGDAHTRAHSPATPKH